MKDQAEQALLNSAAEAQVGLLQQLLSQALGKPGEPLPVAELAAYLPRLTIRKYPDGLLVVAIDAETDKPGKVLFGFGPMEFKPTEVAPGSFFRPTGYKWVALVLDSIEAQVAERSFTRRIQRHHGLVPTLNGDAAD